MVKPLGGMAAWKDEDFMETGNEHGEIGGAVFHQPGDRLLAAVEKSPDGRNGEEDIS